LAHDQDLLAADLIDSLGITELVTFLEARVGIKVGDDDLTAENFCSIDAIANFVTRRGG
jgi:acyl carrier protein